MTFDGREVCMRGGGLSYLLISGVLIFLTVARICVSQQKRNILKTLSF